MARIAFTSMIEEIVGKLAGSVFQDSYLGMQIRTRVSPRNPQSYYQQLRRGEFGYLSAGWRFLSPSDRLTWVTAAGSVPAGKRLYIASNVNLSLVNENPIDSYTPDTTPPAMPMEIVDWILSSFFIAASDSLTTVPTGHTLLIFATSEKDPPKNFINPSNYSPIVNFPAGSDMSAPVDISADWISRFGQFTAEQRICIKSVLINVSNGDRGPDFVNCAIEPFVAVDYIIDSNGDILIDSDGTFITFP